MTRRSARPVRANESGAVALEFGLIVPILLLLVFGLIQYGFYFLAFQSGSDAVRSAARLSAVGNPALCVDLRQRIGDQVGRFGSDVVVTRSFDDADGSGDVSVGDQVRVSLAFKSVDLRMPIVPFVDDGRVATDALSRVEFVNNGQPEACT